jgi:hypothetical protein
MPDPCWELVFSYLISLATGLCQVWTEAARRGWTVQTVQAGKQRRTCEGMQAQMLTEVGDHQIQTADDTCCVQTFVSVWALLLFLQHVLLPEQQFTLSEYTMRKYSKTLNISLPSQENLIPVQNLENEIPMLSNSYDPTWCVEKPSNSPQFSWRNEFFLQHDDINLYRSYQTP